jgi:hypothetical protein
MDPVADATGSNSPARDEAHQPEDQEDKEENLGQSNGCAGDTAETENRSDDRDYQKYQ